jgi:hypothetical protein
MDDSPLRATVWMAGVRFLTVASYFFLLNKVHTDSEAHQFSYPTGTVEYFSWVKQGMEVCVRFSVFVYRLRPCDELITRPRSPTECVRSRKTEVNGEVHGGRLRPTGAVVPRKKKRLWREADHSPPFSAPLTN